MVYMAIPKQLSEQEEELQHKFTQLRKLRKQLAALKAASSRAAEEEAEKQNKKRAHSDAAEAATEKAKKLLQSGAINIDGDKKRTFKRPRHERQSASAKLERSGATAGVVGYEPYQNPEPSKEPQQGSGAPREYVPPMAQSSRLGHRMGNPPRGPRIYVRGDGLTEQLLRETFDPVGTVITLNMELGKCSGFVTYDSAESADEAVSRFNGTLVGNGVRIDVEIARRQDGVTRLRSTDGMTFNSPLHRKGGSKEEPPAEVDSNRDVLVYEEDNMFD